MGKFKTQYDKRPVKGGVFPCDEYQPWAGDGFDPRYDRDSPKKIANRKALQLCAQVRDALNLALSSLSDDVLRDLYVESVVPAPDSTQLLATVITINDPDVVGQHVQNAAGLLRSEIVMSINRKRAPQVKFRVMRTLADTLDEIHRGQQERGFEGRSREDIEEQLRDDDVD